MNQRENTGKLHKMATSMNFFHQKTNFRKFPFGKKYVMGELTRVERGIETFQKTVMCEIRDK